MDEQSQKLLDTLNGLTPKQTEKLSKYISTFALIVFALACFLQLKTGIVAFLVFGVIDHIYLLTLSGSISLRKNVLAVQITNYMGLILLVNGAFLFWWVLSYVV